MNLQEQERSKRVKRSPLDTDTEKVKQEVKLGDKDILFVMGISRLIGIDLNRLRIESHQHVNSSSSDENFRNLPNVPTLFDFSLCGNWAVGSFVFGGKLFILGGSVPYEKGMEDVCYDIDPNEYPCPLGVYEVKFDSSKLNATAQDVLFPSDTVPDLNFPKPIPIVEVIENKVYILNTFDDGTDLCEDFECLDFDAPLSWTTLQSPPFFDRFMRVVDIRGHFVLGSRLYLVVSEGIGVQKPLYFCYFDTKTSSWELDRSIRQSIKDFPVYVMLSGKSTTVDGLEPNSVMLSFFCLYNRSDVESRNLFATLVTDQAQPLCYQNIFGSVFPDDILPSSFVNMCAGVYCVGDRPNHGDKLNCGGKLYCALIMGSETCTDHFLCMSFFELSFVGAFANVLAKETEFLRVEVQEKFICRFDDCADELVSAAFLL